MKKWAGKKMCARGEKRFKMMMKKNLKSGGNGGVGRARKNCINVEGRHVEKWKEERCGRRTNNRL